MIYDLVVKGGTVLTSAGSFLADLGICGEKVAEISTGLSGRKEISAEHMLVLPGGVDPHVHLQMPTATTVTSETWESGSRAAAFGGTTTVIDFVEPNYSNQPLIEAFEQRLSQACGQSAVDFGFHMTLCSGDVNTTIQITDIIRAGMPSFKIYTTYDGFYLKDEAILAVLKGVAQAGGLTMVHAEADAVIQDAVQSLIAAGRKSIHDFPLSRPPISEQEAIERVLSLASYANSPVYIVHVSTAAGSEAIARARANKQLAWGETCPQYLLLNDDAYQLSSFDGAKFVCCPPLRAEPHQRVLWSAAQRDALQTIGTDHCAFNFAGQKELGKEAFWDIPAGLPGIELRLVLMYTYGVKTGLLSPQQWIERCCTMPAKMFGLYPQKGDLTTGSDADIVIFDPNWSWSAVHTELHEQVDYTPYEGMALTGRVLTTMLRGEILVENGEWVGKRPAGKFIPGKPFRDQSWL